MELDNGDMQACATKRNLQPMGGEFPRKKNLPASLRSVASEKFNNSFGEWAARPDTLRIAQLRASGTEVSLSTVQSPQSNER
jgi:hypothetical protein